jgi:VanZ family protein
MLDRLDLRLPRAAFAAALFAVLVLSLLPPSAGSLVTVGWDKANHASGFLVLGLLGLAAHPGRTVPVAAGLLVFGVLIEVLQGMTTWRSAEAADLLADGVGIVAACAFVALARRAGVPWPRAVPRKSARRGAADGPPTA